MRTYKFICVCVCVNVYIYLSIYTYIYMYGYIYIYIYTAYIYICVYVYIRVDRNAYLQFTPSTCPSHSVSISCQTLFPLGFTYHRGQALPRSRLQPQRQEPPFLVLFQITCYSAFSSFTPVTCSSQTVHIQRAQEHTRTWS